MQDKKHKCKVKKTEKKRNRRDRYQRKEAELKRYNKTKKKNKKERLSTSRHLSDMQKNPNVKWEQKKAS